MKRNVDLTIDRFFDRSNLADRLKLDELFRTKSKCPWNLFLEEIETDDQLERQRHAIIIVGDKHERQQVRQFKRIEDTNYCDCCLKKLNVKPWDGEYGICHECREYYSKKKDRCLWRRLGNGKRINISL